MIVKVYIHGRFYNEREFDSVRQADAFAARQLTKGRDVEMTAW